MVSHCIQNLKNKKNGNLRKEAEPHRCYIVPSMLNVPSLYYVLYLCTEVYELPFIGVSVTERSLCSTLLTAVIMSSENVSSLVMLHSILSLSPLQGIISVMRSME